MEWLYSLFIEHSALQAVVVLSLISAIGLGLGKIHVCGISLGVTFVFFAGILAGHFGLSIDPQMLKKPGPTCNPKAYTKIMSPKLSA